MECQQQQDQLRLQQQRQSQILLTCQQLELQCLSQQWHLNLPRALQRMTQLKILWVSFRMYLFHSRNLLHLLGKILLRQILLQQLRLLLSRHSLHHSLEMQHKGLTRHRICRVSQICRRKVNRHLARTQLHILRPLSQKCQLNP